MLFILASFAGPLVCVTDAPSGHRACWDGARAQVVEASPEQFNEAIRRLPLPCLQDPANPSHDVARLVNRGPLRWRKGSPSVQQRACEVADLGEGDEVSHVGWSGMPIEVNSRVPGVRFWRLEQALAIEVEAPNRHAWVSMLPTDESGLPGFEAAAFDSFGALDTEIERVDVDGNGEMDWKLSRFDGGSGGRRHHVCLLDGASTHSACLSVEHSAYSRWISVRRDLQPLTNNRMERFLDGWCPRFLDENDPSFGSIFAGPERPWVRGRPVDQRSGCRESKTPADALRLYETEWKGSTTPVVAASNGRWVAYTHAHAVAIYDTETNRHRWILNLESRAGSGHKVDRWPLIAGVSIKGPALAVMWRTYLDEESSVIEIPLE